MLISLCLIFGAIIFPSDDQTFVAAEDLQQKPIRLTQENDNVTRSDLKKVPDYIVQDQCMALPEDKWLLNNQLVFHLHSEHGFCGGQGLLLCYPSQLDEELGNQRGMVTGIRSRLKNVAENEVTKRCENLREKMATECGQDDEECQMELGAKNWHGILLVSGKNGDIHFHLSTTDRTFPVTRRSFDQLLVLKLASAKNKISFLSKEIGPYRDWTEKRDGQKWIEKRNWINVTEDALLWKQYFEHVHEGIYLRKYAGIWSIGHDLLPLDGQNHIRMFVERSECCEMDAWVKINVNIIKIARDYSHQFLSPTTREMPQFKKMKDAKIVSSEDNVQMSQRNEFIFRGKFTKNGTKMMNFVLRDKLARSPASETSFSIDANKKTLLLKSEGNYHKNYSFPSSPLAEVDHQHFIIKFTFINQSSIEVYFNCEKIDANLSIPINFGGIFHYNFTGDFQLIYSGHELPRVELVEFSPKKGLFVRGLIADATLSLSGPVVVAADADTTAVATAIPWLFDLVARTDLGTIFISNKTGNYIAKGIVPKPGETFEVWILLNDRNPIEIWVNNIKLQTYFELTGIEEGTNKYYVHINTNNNSMHNLVLPIITPAFSPVAASHKINKSMTDAKSEATALTIRGKVLPPESGREEIVTFSLRDSFDNDNNKPLALFTFHIFANKPTKLDVNSKNTTLDAIIEAGKNFTIRFYYEIDAPRTLILKINDVMYPFVLRDKVSQIDIINIYSINNLEGDDSVNESTLEGHLLLLNIF